MIEDMLIQLKKSLKELDKVRKVHDQLTSKMINKLPSDKKNDALYLMEKAKKGVISINEILGFAGKISDKDKEYMKTNIKRANDINK